MEIRTKKKQSQYQLKGIQRLPKKKFRTGKSTFIFYYYMRYAREKKLRPENIVELQRNAHAKQIQLILRVKV